MSEPLQRILLSRHGWGEMRFCAWWRCCRILEPARDARAADKTATPKRYCNTTHKKFAQRERARATALVAGLALVASLLTAQPVPTETRRPTRTVTPCAAGQYGYEPYPDAGYCLSCTARQLPGGGWTRIVENAVPQNGVCVYSVWTPTPTTAPYVPPPPYATPAGAATPPPPGEQLPWGPVIAGPGPLAVGGRVCPRYGASCDEIPCDGAEIDWYYTGTFEPDARARTAGNFFTDFSFPCDPRRGGNPLTGVGCAESIPRQTINPTIYSYAYRLHNRNGWSEPCVVSVSVLDSSLPPPPPPLTEPPVVATAVPAPTPPPAPCSGYSVVFGTCYDNCTGREIPCPGAASPTRTRTRTPAPPTPVVPTTTGCVVDGKTLCLSAARFAVQAAWTTRDGSTGQADAVPLTTDTGYFWFFSAGNVELVVKVLDGRGVNEHFWVFAGGLTDVEVDLTITDTQTAQERTYRSAQGTAFAPIQDTSAFPVAGQEQGAGWTMAAAIAAAIALGGGGYWRYRKTRSA